MIVIMSNYFIIAESLHSESSSNESWGLLYIPILQDDEKSLSSIYVCVCVSHLPPASLQLGQVQATLRSLLPSCPTPSVSSSSILTRRCDRSLVFRVESPLSAQSSVSGSSLI